MRAWVIKIGYIVLAIVLIAVCVNMFLGPHDIAAGGLTGLAIILEQWLGLSRGWVILAGNVLVLGLALVFLGREVFFNTIIGAGLLPLAVAVVPRLTLVSDRMLSMAVGSVIFGVAVAIMYANNASSGGTAVPPLIFKKHFGLSPSIGLFAMDGLVVVLCLVVFDIDAFFFAIASIFITSATMHYIENGLSKKKLVYIISSHHEKITKDIQQDIGRGVTLIPSQGAYDRQERPMLLVTLAKKDYTKLRTVVDRHDAQAFMITDTVSDVHGRGFTYDSGTV